MMAVWRVVMMAAKMAQRVDVLMVDKMDCTKVDTLVVKKVE